MTNEVRTGKWMRAAQKGLKMSCFVQKYLWKNTFLIHF